MQIDAMNLFLAKQRAGRTLILLLVPDHRQRVPKRREVKPWFPGLRQDSPAVCAGGGGADGAVGDSNRDGGFTGGGGLIVGDGAARGGNDGGWGAAASSPDILPDMLLGVTMGMTAGPWGPCAMTYCTAPAWAGRRRVYIGLSMTHACSGEPNFSPGLRPALVGAQLAVTTLLLLT